MSAVQGFTKHTSARIVSFELLKLLVVGFSAFYAWQCDELRSMCLSRHVSVARDFIHTCIYAAHTIRLAVSFELRPRINTHAHGSCIAPCLYCTAKQAVRGADAAETLQHAPLQQYQVAPG